MSLDHEPLTPRWIVFGTALVYFALGSLVTAHFMHLKEVWADSHRVFQMEIHHAMPAKAPALAAHFRASRLQATHDFELVKYGRSEKAEQFIQGCALDVQTGR